MGRLRTGFIPPSPEVHDPAGCVNSADEVFQDLKRLEIRIRVLQIDVARPVMLQVKPATINGNVESGESMVDEKGLNVLGNAIRLLLDSQRVFVHDELRQEGFRNCRSSFGTGPLLAAGSDESIVTHIFVDAHGACVTVQIFVFALRCKRPASDPRSAKAHFPGVVAGVEQLGGSPFTRTAVHKGGRGDEVEGIPFVGRILDLPLQKRSPLGRFRRLEFSGISRYGRQCNQGEGIN